MVRLGKGMMSRLTNCPGAAGGCLEISLVNHRYLCPPATQAEDAGKAGCTGHPITCLASCPRGCLYLSLQREMSLTPTVLRG